MITLNKKHKKAVDAAQLKVQELMVKQNDVFTALCKKVGVTDDTPEAESLWDHVFNETDWVIEYTEK